MLSRTVGLVKRNRIRVAITVVAGFFLIGVVAEEQTRKERLREGATSRSMEISGPLFKLAASADVNNQAEQKKKTSDHEFAKVMNQFAVLINQANEAEKQKKLAQQRAERARQKQANDIVAELVISALFGSVDETASEEYHDDVRDGVNARLDDREKYDRRDAAIAAERAPYYP